MTERPWWSGTVSVFSKAFMDFMLAVHGLIKAHDRLAEEEDPHTTIECCWWIGAATEACGRKGEDSILGGFYWVRNNGFHETATALRQVMPGGPNELDPGVVLTIPEARWLPLEGREDGSREFFNRHLARKPVLETITDAREMIVSIWEDVRSESGVQDLPLP